MAKKRHMITNHLSVTTYTTIDQIPLSDPTFQAPSLSFDDLDEQDPPTVDVLTQLKKGLEADEKHTIPVSKYLLMGSLRN